MQPRVQFATAWVADIDGMPCQVLVFHWRVPQTFQVIHRCQTDCLHLEFTYEWDLGEYGLGESYFKNCLDPDGEERRNIEKIFAKQKIKEWPIP